MPAYNTMILTFATIAFGLAWWLGMYLIARDLRKPLLRRVGLGLLAYALALGFDLLRVVSGSTVAADVFGRLYRLCVYLPALGWTGAGILLLPESWPFRARLDLFWRLGLAPLTLLALALLALLGNELTGVLFWIFCLLLLLPLLGVLVSAVVLRRAMRPAPIAGLLIVVTLFFGLSIALMLLPLNVPRDQVLLGMGVDLVMLGLAVAVFDAFDEGEAVRADLLRSFLAAAGAGTLIAGQIGLAIALGSAPTLPLLAALLGTTLAAVTVQTLAAPIQVMLDRFAFPQAPALRQARADLQAGVEALPRVNAELELATLDPAEFVRFTRRALSHYGDLGRLASSPLTRLLAIDRRLAARGAPDHPIERATELKLLLAERIARLKPLGAEFGTTDEWRHYNALYFPYVLGLRPYSRRSSRDDLDPVAQRALDWLAVQVPERTLYNWQNAAARLIAEDLRSLA